MHTRVKGLILLGPALAINVLFFAVPMFYMLVISFTQKMSFFSPEPQYTVSNYTDVVESYSFDFENSFKLALGATLISLIAGYPFAYFLVRKVKRLTTLFNSFLIFPLFGELYIAYGLWFLFLPYGPLGFIFTTLHIPIIKVLYTPLAAMVGIAITAFPFMILNIGTSLSQLDPIFEERAKSLGASPWQSFLRITLPLTLPGMAAGSLMVLGLGLWAFVIPEVLGGKFGTRVISHKIYQTGLLFFNFGSGAALAIALLLIAGVISYITLRYGRGGITL